MGTTPNDVLSRTFARLVPLRVAVIAIYALLVPIAAMVALQIPRKGGIEQLVVPGDPDEIANLDVRGPTERDAALAAIDRALAHADVNPVRRVGSPYVQSWLERQSASAAGRSLGLFGVLFVVITWILYRSPRAVLAIALALGTAVVLEIGRAHV